MVEGPNNSSCRGTRSAGNSTKRKRLERESIMKGLPHYNGNPSSHSHRVPVVHPSCLEEGRNEGTSAQPLSVTSRARTRRFISCHCCDRPRHSARVTVA